MIHPSLSLLGKHWQRRARAHTHAHTVASYATVPACRMRPPAPTGARFAVECIFKVQKGARRRPQSAQATVRVRIEEGEVRSYFVVSHLPSRWTS